MAKRPSIVRQATERLQEMASWGRSKHADKLANGGKPALDRIYSYSTMANYKDVAAHFAMWARDTHGYRDIDQARELTGAYLQQRMDSGLSAWTVRRDAAALGKLYQCPTTELGAALPVRHRGDVTQHRGESVGKGFSETRNQDLVDLCRSTGLRRHEVAQLRPEDVTKTADGRVLVHVTQGKGGKERTVTALNDRPLEIAAQAKAEGRDQVIERIPNRTPIHAYRAEYARSLYNELARDVSTLPRSEVYVCRLDLKDVEFDKAAMQAASEALGHSRLDVMTSYLV